MSLHPPYISRPQTEIFLNLISDALRDPISSPVVFHIWGMGGVGKSTLTRKVRETHQEKAKIAEVLFGLTEKVDEPLALMKKLYEQVVQQDSWSDPFWEVYELYQETAYQLVKEPISGKKTVEEDQLKWVKQLLKVGVSLTGNYLQLSEDVKKQAQGIVDEGVNTAAAALSIKDNLYQFLQQHKSTKGKKQLQKLMVDPLASFTDAFVEGLGQQAKRQPIIIILDTYEKVSVDIDIWLWKSLLANTSIQSYPIRLVVASRHCILKNEGWRKLNQDKHLILEQTIYRFDQQKTKEYLNEIGIRDEAKIQQVFQVTKGLPYYLNWVRKEQIQGNNPDFSQGNEEIVSLLLQGLSSTQKQVVQFAACYRWFDRKLIQHLMEQKGLDFATAADEKMNCFGWLVEQTFVELVQGCYRLDDVARDIFRQSLYQDDRDLFCLTHKILANHFKVRSEQEITASNSYSAKYENPEWRSFRAEYIYHLAFSRDSNESQNQFRSHLLESLHFQQSEVVQIPLEAITAEFELDNHPFLSYSDRTFLIRIRPAIEYGWLILEKASVDYTYNQDNYGLSKQVIDQAAQTCLNPIETLEGLAKFLALFYKSIRCTVSQRDSWLQQAQTQAEQIVEYNDADFNSGLFIWKIGSAWLDTEYYEEAVLSYDKAIKFKPESSEAWNNRGIALFNLQRYEEAIDSYKRAIEIQPDKYHAWDSCGIAFSKLKRYEEAISSYDEAIEIKPNDHQAWYNRGVALCNLGNYQAAIDSWSKALSIRDDYPSPYYNSACLYAQLDNIDLALDNLQAAIALNPKKYLSMAQKDSDFEKIRNDPRFCSLFLS